LIETGLLAASGSLALAQTISGIDTERAQNCAGIDAPGHLQLIQGGRNAP
jgi:hypothetical protein